MNRQYNKAESISQSALSGFVPEPTRTGDLPLLPCPECGLTVTKLVSTTPANPGRVFYRCTNKMTKCKFWKWDHEYQRFVAESGIVIPSCTHPDETVRSLEVQFHHFINELNRRSEQQEQQTKELVALLKKKITVFGVMLIGLLLMILFVLLSKGCNCLD